MASTTRTARRRWTRELTGEVDGIALDASGPVLLHGYDPPAGGRWIDSAIPGRLSALERGTGEARWTSPCEVGYGRGFGAGFGRDNDAVVLGPSTHGHRIVRMSLDNGELVAASDIKTFDEALVFGDLCLTASARHVSAIETGSLRELWTYTREGERYHHVGRSGRRVFVVFTQESTRRKGVLCLDAQNGAFDGLLLAPNQRAIHDLAVDERGAVLLCSDLENALPREILIDYLVQGGDDESGQGAVRLALVALEPTAAEGDAPLWFESLAGEDGDLPEISVSADSGKLYIVRGALLEVRDTLTGRLLGDWAVPGLDERVAWKVAEGAGLLAEETRVSIFELPA